MLGSITAYLINPGFCARTSLSDHFSVVLFNSVKKKKKNSCQYAQLIETLAFNEGCAPDTRIGNSALGVKKL